MIIKECPCFIRGDLKKKLCAPPPRFKSLKEIFVYFDCVQLAIGGRGQVIKHMRESTVHNQNKNTLSGKRDKYRVV